MNCNSCGASLGPNDVFCQNCGTRVEGGSAGFSEPKPYGNPYQDVQGNDGKSPNGTLILILGIVGILMCQIAGIVAWVMASKEEQLYPNDQNVKVGKILGMVCVGLMIFGLVIGVGIVIFTFVIAAAAATM